MAAAEVNNTTTRPAPAAAAVDPARAAESNSALFLTIICIFSSLAITAASLRFYTRAILVRSFGKDDVFMAIAVLCAVGGLISWIIESRVGYGRHQDTINRSDYVVLLEMQFIQSVVEASFAFGFLKISIAFSLLRLSRSKWYKTMLWALIVFTCVYTLFAFSTFLAFCQPVSAQWDRTVPHKCYNKELYRDFGLFNAACNIFTDVAFATLPIPLIWSLQLQRRIRIYLIAILSGGYFAVALGIAKAIFIIAFVHERDGTFYPWSPFFGSLQLDIGIIAACAPTLRPLLGTVLKLSTHLNHYREANYYRAGKALDRLPMSGAGNSARGYRKQNTASGEFIQIAKSRSPGGGANSSSQTWTTVGGNRADTSFSVKAVRSSSPQTQHVEDLIIREKGVISPEALDLESGSDDMAIHPANCVDHPDFKGIVKTTEFRVEK
ncbi:hypothetical protein B0H66DRAFT_584563 [Apodospora peruviana]|uniref:Rhodopsin domain-containing protein n=1 Tax=Apodospora peruviana TaxID=516989 RepID=A0AAE0HWR1_9PEZI|nr:hypothetical protein B0H66DRAFT_584563 [Apodospora peruviana]